jgi:sigma-B regulation protein RsbU (phosphoserine phosphatase)
LLSQLNRKFLDWANSDRYSTLAFAAVDRRAGAAQISVAGHPRPAIIRADGTVEYVGDGGYPIGMLVGASYASTQVVLGPGDRLVLFTDGFLESRLPDGGCLGYEGMAALLRSVAGLEISRMVGALVGDFRRVTRREAGDDISVIIAGYA